MNIRKDVLQQGFEITGGKGFHMTFKNGWTISVQWGAGNYSGNYNLSIMEYCNGKKKLPKSFTAEIAIFDRQGSFHIPNKNEVLKISQTKNKDEFSGDSVAGYLTADQILVWINYVSSRP